jgi:hypothetical protein
MEFQIWVERCQQVRPRDEAQTGAYLSELGLFRASSEVLLDALANGRDVILDHVSKLLQIVHPVFEGLASTLQVNTCGRGVDLAMQKASAFPTVQDPMWAYLIELVDGEVCVDLGNR